MMSTTDSDWEPPNPPHKVVLPTPVRFFTVTRVSDCADGLGWKCLGACTPRATSCGARAELRFPGGGSRVIRIGGITSASIIVTQPQPVPDVPLGTEVWLLETEECDYASLVLSQTSPLPIFTPITNPVDRDYRRQLRANIDKQLDLLPHSGTRELLSDNRVPYPARLMDGSWVVYDLPDGQRVLFHPERGLYSIVTLEDERSSCKDIDDVLVHLRRGRARSSDSGAT